MANPNLVHKRIGRDCHTREDRHKRGSSTQCDKGLEEGTAGKRLQIDDVDAENNEDDSGPAEHGQLFIY